MPEATHTRENYGGALRPGGLSEDPLGAAAAAGQPSGDRPVLIPRTDCAENAATRKLTADAAQPPATATRAGVAEATARTLGPRRVDVVSVLWSAWYAAHRFDHAFGGHLGMVGSPAPAAHFRRENLIAGFIILLAAILPVVVVMAWRNRLVARLAPVVGWVAAVGCCTHAVTLWTLRVSSLTGLHASDYPAGCDVHRPTQGGPAGRLLNEPWFVIGAASGDLRARGSATGITPVLAAVSCRGGHARGRYRGVERVGCNPDGADWASGAAN